MSPMLSSGLLADAGFRHAFLGRRRGGTPAAVLGVPAGRIYRLRQVHGSRCRRLAGDEDAAAVAGEKGDALISRAEGVACAVQTADCVPLLLADRHGGAVAAVHAGWRGTVAGVVASAVASLRQLAGDGACLLAAVGPHIGPCCFEVGDEVAAELAAASDLAGDAVRRSAGRPHVDLRRIVEAQLLTAGVAQIDHVTGCTMCDPRRFHSYRRDGPRAGRMLSAIAVRGGPSAGSAAT